MNKMNIGIESKRRHLLKGLWALIGCGAVILIAALFLIQKTENTIFLSICIYLIIGTAVFLGIVILIIGIRIIIAGGIRRYIVHHRIINKIEQNLICIGAYRKNAEIAYAVLPKIKVSADRIIIDLSDIAIREKIVQRMEHFSTALFGSYVVVDYYLNNAQDKLMIEYEDGQKSKQEVFTLELYKAKTLPLKSDEFYIDRKHTVDLQDYPHIMIAGMTSSGKSYAAQELVLQAIWKNWEVVILDIKRSYGLFRQQIDYVVEPQDIIIKLQEIEKEMYERLRTLEPLLNEDPRAIASDCGYRRKMVVIEEFIALQTALSKKEKDELERVVKNISVLARQADIHILVVLQAAGTENINSSVRAQFLKILLGGQIQSNILVATFGTGVTIPEVAHTKQPKGNGLIQMDRITQVRFPLITDIENFKINNER